MAYDNSNSGFVGKNTKKETEKHPDITGFAEVGGVEYWVSGWKNAKGYGLRFKPKEERQQEAPRNAPQDVDNDGPF
jgi:hypothetical protein